MIRTLAILLLLCPALNGLVSRTQTSSGDARPREPVPVDAVQGIVAAFKQHNVVLIGERHGLRETADFYIRLVRNAAFHRTVQDVVIEFASRQNQPLLDRYIGGGDVPLKDLQHIWRDTTKVASWESPVYAEWLAAIRDVNRSLPAEKRLRVLAGDTAIDWNRIRTHEDWAALGDNNISIAEVIAREVLAKEHHALVVLGSNHVIKSGDRNGAPNVTTRLESQYRGSTYVVLLLNARIFDQYFESQLKLPSAPFPALYDLSATDAAAISDQKGAQLISKTDALLYLRPTDAFHEVNPAREYFDPDYLRELDRRSMIEWGDLRLHRFLPYPNQ